MQTVRHFVSTPKKVQAWQNGTGNPPEWAKDLAISEPFIGPKNYWVVKEEGKAIASVVPDSIFSEQFKEIFPPENIPRSLLVDKKVIAYTVGFAFFAHPNEQVQCLLIRKNRPDWQKGKLNGVGGKIKEAESSMDCMIREFKEETDVDTTKDDWKFVQRESGEGYQLDIYAIRLSNDFFINRSPTDENLEIYPVETIRSGKLSLVQNVLGYMENSLDAVGMRTHFRFP